MSLSGWGKCHRLRLPLCLCCYHGLKIFVSLRISTENIIVVEVGIFFFFKFFLPLNDNCYLLRFSVRDREWRIKTIVLWLQVEVVWCFGADDNSQVMIF